MAGALSKYFKKINFANTSSFEDTKIDKIVVQKLENTWTVYITNKEPINVEDMESLIIQSRSGFDNVKKVDFVINNEHFHDQNILEYIKYYMKQN